MNRQPPSSAKRRAAKLGTYFRRRDAEHAGLTLADLHRKVATGVITKVRPRLYRIAAAPTTEFETIAMVAAMVPNGVVCLLSALRLHEIGTQSPHQVWLALDRKAREPARLRTQVRFVRSSHALLFEGVESKRLLGVEVRLTSPARTVVDCFRFRNKIGLDVALEALRDVLRSKLATRDELLRIATRCRARTVLRAYLEAIAP